MKGTIRTKERCPKCGGKFANQPLECSQCLTNPNRYYLDFPWAGQRLKLYSGPDGYPLDSWEGASRLLAAMRVKVDAGTFDPREYVGAAHNSLRFEHYAREWCKRLAQRRDWGEVSRGYYLEAVRRVEHYLIPALGPLSIRDIHEAVLIDLRYRFPQNLKPSSVKEIYSTMRNILKDAYTRRDIGRVPAFPPVKVNQTVIRWLKREDQAKVLAATPHPNYRALFQFLMTQGCRPGEAMALKWADVDLAEGRVIIRAAMDRGVYRPYNKNRQERILTLHPKTLMALRGLTSRFKRGFVFTRPSDGQPMTSQGALIAWQRAVAKAGVPYVSLYQGTKHSLASQAVNGGVPLEIIAAAFGHRDVRSTKRYTQVEGTPIEKLWEE